MWAVHTAKTLARAAIDYEPVGLAGSPQRSLPCIGGAAVAVGQVYRDRLGRQRRRPLRRYIHAPDLRRRCATALQLPHASVPALSCYKMACPSSGRPPTVARTPPIVGRVAGGDDVFQTGMT